MIHVYLYSSFENPMFAQRPNLTESEHKEGDQHENDQPLPEEALPDTSIPNSGEAPV